MKNFYCDPCGKWTTPRPGDPLPTCSRCGEPYVCGECGFDIDWAGDCQREEVTGEGHGAAEAER